MQHLIIWNIANPNCSTAQLVLPLKVLHDNFGIDRIVVFTYQSVSGAGKEAITELEQQSRANLSGQDVAPSVFPHHIAIMFFLKLMYLKKMATQKKR